MFLMLEHLEFLKSGCCLYKGPVESVLPYFSSRGFPVPSNYNPAEWIMTVSESLATTQELEAKNFFINFPENTPAKGPRNSLYLNKQLSMFHMVDKRKIGSAMSGQAKLLLKRGITNLF